MMVEHLTEITISDFRELPKNFSGVVTILGNKLWFLNGLLHREDGPAIENADGGKSWLLNGKHHRENGPAVEHADGRKSWWFQGENYTEANWQVKVANPEQCLASEPFVLTLNLKAGESVPEGFSGIVVWSDRTKEWYLNGLLHREDGPAVEKADGTKLWYKNNKSHRVGGPACDWPDGTKHWNQNGRFHRTDGPAIVYPNGSGRWYLNGISNHKMNEINPRRIFFVKNNDLDSIPSGFSGVAVWPSGTLVWYLKGKIHCEDGPAWERVDGYKAWFVDGKRHRKDGPAIVYPNGNEFWYLNGKEYSKADWQAEVSTQPKEGN